MARRRQTGERRRKRKGQEYFLRLAHRNNPGVTNPLRGSSKPLPLWTLVTLPVKWTRGALEALPAHRSCGSVKQSKWPSLLLEEGEQSPAPPHPFLGPYQQR